MRDAVHRDSPDKELWLKQIVHELKLALRLVRADKLIEVHKNLSRVSRIQGLMTASWDILSTLTPTDYLTFRGVLGTASGFQSAQFRQFEFLLGFKEGAHLKFQEEGSEQHRALAEALNSPSLWDEANAALARAASRCRPRCWSATGASPTAERGGRGGLGRGYRTRQMVRFYQSPRSWSTSTTHASCGTSCVTVSG